MRTPHVSGPRSDRDRSLERGSGTRVEYACSKGNNDAIQIMVGARNAEKAASEKPKTPAGIPISQAK